MTEMTNIVSLSGGKDSTAMILMMLERGENISEIIFFDTGFEFPSMIRHIEKLEAYIDRPIKVLLPKVSFEYTLYEKPIIRVQGEDKGKIHRYGNGWPAWKRRWCTRIKLGTIERFMREVKYKFNDCVGIAYNEPLRIKDKRYPLVEYKVTESEALQYCYDHGFDWEGLYEDFCVVSCFCCPLKKMRDLKKLYTKYPDLWAKMLEMDSKIKPNRGFKGYHTIHDLDRRFEKESKQQTFFDLDKVVNLY